MSDFIYFILGTTLGGMFGVAAMCVLQINRGSLARCVTSSAKSSRICIRALYDTGVTAEYGDKLITLSTCEYSAQNGRLVVVAKKVN